MQYYGQFYRSALNPLLARINAYLVRWIRKKYKRLQGSKKARRKLRRDHRTVPPHVRALEMGLRRLVDQDDKSRVSREATHGSVGAGG